MKKENWKKRSMKQLPSFLGLLLASILAMYCIDCLKSEKLNICFLEAASFKEVVKIAWFFTTLIISFIWFFTHGKTYSLSFLTLLPLATLSRDVFFIYSTNFTISAFDIILFINIFGALIRMSRHKNVQYPVNVPFVILFVLFGFLFACLNENYLAINGFVLAYTLPILYYLIMIASGVSFEDVLVISMRMLLLSFFIFILQNIYLGPITVYQTTVNQAWLHENISFANGGFIEIGAMEVMLAPIAILHFAYKNKLKLLLSRWEMMAIKFVSICVLIMPFVYHNRASALYVLVMLFPLLLEKFGFLKSILISMLLMVPGAVYLIEILQRRSFTSSGYSMQIFGYEFENLNETTYKHLISSYEGFLALKENFILGTGFFMGPDSFNSQLFKIGSFRNIFLPAISTAIYNGLIFFLFYCLFMAYFFYKTKSTSMRFLWIAPFIPVVGMGHSFGIYATGWIDLGEGFVSLSDNPPVAFYSYGIILLMLLISLEAKNSELT